MRLPMTSALIAVVCGSLAGGAVARVFDGGDPTPRAAAAQPVTAARSPAPAVTPAAIYRRDVPGNPAAPSRT